MENQESHSPGTDSPAIIEQIERASIDVQISTAHRFPRSMEKFKKNATDMVSLDRETAESCIYRRPVGKDPETGQQKIAEGASIRLAEIVGACYGNLRVASRIIEQTPQYVRVEAMAHDLENNYAAKSEVVESTVGRNGNPYGERQRAVVAKAALAKAHRDATFKVVPRALCKTIIDKAKEVINGGRTLEQRRAGAHAWIKTLKIDEKRVWASLGIGGLNELGEGHIIDLLGIKTAIEDKDSTVDEAFPPLNAENPDAPDTRTMSEKLAAKTAAGKTVDVATTKATEEKKAEPAKTETPAPTPAATEEPAENIDREALVKRMEETCLDLRITESKMFDYAKKIPGLVHDGAASVWEISTASLLKLEKALPALGKKG